jgi:hypothetical protein
MRPIMKQQRFFSFFFFTNTRTALVQGVRFA